MSAVFVETTVLTDLLLKKDGSEKRAAAALSHYKKVHIPQFAWKEFKRGPLANFVWFHNKLADTKSFLGTLAALQRLSRSPQRYLTSTAIQAAHTAFHALFDPAVFDRLKSNYGESADLDALHADALRLEVRRVVHKAWKSRRSLYGGVMHRLSCYPDEELTEDSDRIELAPRDCPKGVDCCLKTLLGQRSTHLEAVRTSLPDDGRKETAERYKILRQIEKHQSRLMDPKDCRRFGDAYFALFCPDGASIITTNVQDIEPMATALGKTVTTP